MNRRQFIAALSTVLSVPAALTALPGYSNTQPFIIGIFPRRNIQTTYRLFTPVAKYLSQILQREVRLETAKSFSEFWQNVEQRKFDLVHFNQYHYILAHLYYNYDVILKNKELGQTTIAGSLVVRKDSGFNSVADLKGKVILFGGDRSAMQSYISATWLLQQAGLKQGDYIEKFAINPPNTIISTYFKRADAAGSGDGVLQLNNVRKRIDITQLKFLAKTEPMTHLPWAIRADLPADLKTTLQQALVALSSTDDGLQILHKAQLDALVPATDSEYDLHRKIITDVYGADYGYKIHDK